MALTEPQPLVPYPVAPLSALPVCRPRIPGNYDLVDMLDILRRQAGRFQCPKCGQSLADCRLEMVAQQDDQSLVKVTCAQCQDTRLIAVAVAAEVPSAPVVEVRDQPVEELGPPISADDILDVRLALAQYDGDLAGLLR